MTWLLVAALAWVLLALPLALVLGRGLRMVDDSASRRSWVDEVERYVHEQAATPLR
jgi:hypothetical protein